ncbi:MAG: hypothetical protein HRT87_00200 [Legionellales bacterium]|nr:hypothetical protein [Legionellales bacterium]
MRKLEIDDVKKRKFHDASGYRLRVRLLQYSIYLMIGQSIILVLIYLTQPEPLYFATNSASAIKPIIAMSEPNMSSEAILAPDLPEETTTKSLTVE